VQQIQRHSFLQTAIAAFPFVALAQSSTPPSSAGVHPVPSGEDLANTPHPTPYSSMKFKVGTRDANGGHFVIEHNTLKKGGPPRHLHYEQEEWFYMMEGEMVVELGQERLRLKPGDSVPHVWAYVGDKPGRLLIAFAPGKMAFFREITKPQRDSDGRESVSRIRTRARGSAAVGVVNLHGCEPAMKKIKRSAVSSAAILCLVVVVSMAQRASVPTAALPRLEGETLSGKKIVLPDDAHGKIALLAIGFSRQGGDATRVWSDHFKKDFGADPRFAVYSVAELEGAPRFVRGMIVGSIRKGIPTAERDRFVTLFQGSEGLKRFVGFSGSDDAHLLLLDADGTVQWRGHGIFREENYSALQTAAKKLAAQ
jgi:quercetin dioxygenase-like cupin family protein